MALPERRYDPSNPDQAGDYYATMQEESLDRRRQIERLQDERDEWKLRAERERDGIERLREAAKRVLEADMRGVRDLDALNALEDAAGFTQQGQRRG